LPFLQCFGDYNIVPPEKDPKKDAEKCQTRMVVRHYLPHIASFPFFQDLWLGVAIHGYNLYIARFPEDPSTIFHHFYNMAVIMTIPFIYGSKRHFTGERQNRWHTWFKRAISLSLTNFMSGSPAVGLRRFCAPTTRQRFTSSLWRWADVGDWYDLRCMMESFWKVPSGKRLHNYGKSQFLMGKLTINGHFQ
jgi:hypothetical protein